LDCRNLESISQSYWPLNGRYRAYFNKSEELEPNEYLRRAILKDMIPFERKFWNGDVFVLKVSTRMVKRPNTFSGPDFELQDNGTMEIDHNSKGATIYDDVSSFCMKFNGPG
jgi:hypothetical protein